MTTDTWTGTGDWTVASNWSNGLPTSTSDVFIQSGGVTTLAPIAVNSVVVNYGATMGLVGAGACSVAGDLTAKTDLTLDSTPGDPGGTALTIGGVLASGVVRFFNFQYGSLTIGNSAMTKSDVVSAAGLTNNSALDLNGGASAAASVLLSVSGFAGFGAPGPLYGRVALTGFSTIEFASGQINSIPYGQSLLLDGPNAVIEASDAPGPNSALNGLDDVGGDVVIADGVSLATSGPLSVGDTFTVSRHGHHTTYSGGSIAVDPFGDGGSQMSVGGVLSLVAGVGQLSVGNSAMTRSDRVTVGGLAFQGGSIAIIGGATSAAEAILDVCAANTVLSGRRSVTVSGSAAFYFSGGLVNRSAIALDAGAGAAQLLSVGRVLVNLGALDVGGSSARGVNDVTAKALFNSGSIILSGGATEAAAARLSVAGAASFGAQGVLSGRVDVSGRASIAFAGGEITVIRRRAKLTLTGRDAVIADAAHPRINSALAGLATVSGTLSLNDGAALAPLGALRNDGAILLRASQLNIRGEVTGRAGLFTLSDRSRLEFAARVSADETVSFAGADTLGFSKRAAEAFAGKIAHFGPGDRLDLHGFGRGSQFVYVESAKRTAGVLTVTNGADVARFVMEGDYRATQFALASTADESQVRFV